MSEKNYLDINKSLNRSVLNISRSKKSSHLFDGFNQVVKSSYSMHNIDLDCSKIPSFEEFDFHNRKSGYLKQFFELLDEISKPCLYWFECKDVETALEAKGQIEVFSKDYNIHKRKTPATNKNRSSNFFYVGVRQGGVRKKDGFTNIAGRMFQHLGYYSKGSTQGLQLVHWSKHAYKITILELQSDSKSYLNVLEKLYAIEFNPLIGRH